MIDFSDSESSAPGYSSPDDDDYNTDVQNMDADDDEELLLDKKNRAVEERFSLQAANRGSSSSSSPATPAGIDDPWLSTQPVFQSTTKQQQQQRRISSRRKTSPGITSTIVDVIRGEANYSIPKKKKFQKQQAVANQPKQQPQDPVVRKEQQQQQPPMKKRKISLSPTDSLARHREIGEGTAGVVIDLLADDDDDDDGKASNSNSLSPIELAPKVQCSTDMLAAAKKQQKEHVAATKRMKQQHQKSSLEYANGSTNSNVSVVLYESMIPNESTLPKNSKSLAKQDIVAAAPAATNSNTKLKKSSKVSGVSCEATPLDESTPPKQTVAATAAAADVVAPATKTKKSKGKGKVLPSAAKSAEEARSKPNNSAVNDSTTATADATKRKRKRKADQRVAAVEDSGIASTTPAGTASKASKAAQGTTTSAVAAAENKVVKTAKRKDTAAKSTQTKKKKKKRTTFEDELLQKIFMSCRPYNMKDLIQLMGKTASEASVNFCLLSLIDKGWVIKKEFRSGNRSKELYWANQESKDKKLWALECLQLSDMATISETRMELANLQQQHKRFAQELVTVEQTPSNEQLSILFQNAQKEAGELSARLEAMKQRIASGSATNQGTMTSKANRFGGRAGSLWNTQQKNPTKKWTPLQLKKQINTMRDHWIKRKRKCMDFVDALADGMEKKVKDVVKKILELETDEDENAKIPPKYSL